MRPNSEGACRGRTGMATSMRSHGSEHEHACFIYIYPDAISTGGHERENKTSELRARSEKVQVTFSPERVTMVVMSFGHCVTCVISSEESDWETERCL